MAGGSRVTAMVLVLMAGAAGWFLLSDSGGGEAYPFVGGEVFEYKVVRTGASDPVIRKVETFVEAVSRFKVKSDGSGFCVDLLMLSRVRTTGQELSSYPSEICFRKDGRRKSGPRHYCALWLPPGLRFGGSTFRPVASDLAFRVGGPVQWRSWRVWEVSSGNWRFYYDVDTGFLVGKEDGRLAWVLTKANAQGFRYP